MKKINKCLLFLLLLATFFAFSACSARSAISADEFQKAAKSSGYTVKQSTTTDANIVSYYNGTTSNADDELDYMVASSDSGAQETYVTVKNSIATGSSKPQTIDSSSYCKYVVTNGELYYVVARLDKTIIYAKTTVSNKAKVDSFFSSIKY